MLGYEVNAVIDACPDSDLSFAEVHIAAQEGTLVLLLMDRFGSLFSVFKIDCENTFEINSILREAAEALDGRENKKVGVKNNGLCLVMAIILQAIAIYSKK